MLAGALLILFFSAPAFVYGRWRARGLRAGAAGGRPAPARLARFLAMPLLVAACTGLYLADRALGEAFRQANLSALITGGPVHGMARLSTGNDGLDLVLGLLRTLGGLALILFFVTIPYVLGSLIAVALSVSDAGGRWIGASDAIEDAAAGKAEMLETSNDRARLTIAIDGPAAAGKGTLAKRIAARYALPYLDTGLLYRAIGRLAADRGVDLDDPVATGAIARALDTAHLDDASLRGREAGEFASRVAVHPPVRQALEAFQRAFAAGPQGAVLDGRDIGTVICPDADVKIFVTASAEVRARRRTDELSAKGRAVDYERILAEVRERDARDAGRSTAPLKAAEDAHLLDTSEMDIETAFRAACELIDRSGSKRNGA